MRIQIYPFLATSRTWQMMKKSQWLNEICIKILKKYFFDKSTDVCKQLRENTGNPDHPENYWVQNFEDGRIWCHVCHVIHVCSCRLVESHESKMQNITIKKQSKESKQKDTKADQLKDYSLMLLKLVTLHKTFPVLWTWEMGSDLWDPQNMNYQYTTIPIRQTTVLDQFILQLWHMACFPPPKRSD